MEGVESLMTLLHLGYGATRESVDVAHHAPTRHGGSKRVDVHTFVNMGDAWGMHCDTCWEGDMATCDLLTRKPDVHADSGQGDETNQNAQFTGKSAAGPMGAKWD